MRVSSASALARVNGFHFVFNFACLCGSAFYRLLLRSCGSIDITKAGQETLRLPTSSFRDYLACCSSSHIRLVSNTVGASGV
jgi:hypothetical protein